MLYTPPSYSPGDPSASQATVGASASLAIDPTSGSDSNPGTLAAPWKTAAQFARAVGATTMNEVNVAMVLTLLGDVPASDPLVRPRIGSSGTLLVTGSSGATSLHTGTFTAVSAPNAEAGTNEAQTITDSALGTTSWATSGAGGSSLLGKRIRITSGARAGGICWGLANTGTRKARCTQPILGSVALPLSPAGATLVAPAVSDPYAVESLPMLTILDPYGYASASLGASVDTYYRTVIEGVRLMGVGTSPLGLPWIGRTGQGGVIFLGCDLGALGGWYVAHGCIADNQYMYHGDFFTLNACGVLSSFDQVLLVRGGLQVDQGTVFEAMEVRGVPGGGITWLDGAVFDSPAHGLRMTTGSAARVSGPLYGKSNAGQGAHVDVPGASIGLVAVTPTITGATQVAVGATTSTWAAVAGTTLTVANSSAGTVA